VNVYVFCHGPVIIDRIEEKVAILHFVVYTFST